MHRFGFCSSTSTRNNWALLTLSNANLWSHCKASMASINLMFISAWNYTQHVKTQKQPHYEALRRQRRININLNVSKSKKTHMLLSACLRRVDGTQLGCEMGLSGNDRKANCFMLFQMPTTYEFRRLRRSLNKRSAAQFGRLLLAMCHLPLYIRRPHTVG